MEIITQYLIFSSSIITFLAIPAQSVITCEPDSCHSSHGPSIRFPFWLKNRHQARCGYPGFDLYCNSRNQTILNLPQSGEFTVDHIDYSKSSLYINDPGSCLPNRALNFSLSGSPFRAPHLTNFIFLKCSFGWTDYTTSSGDSVPLFCLSERNMTVLAVNLRSPAADIMLPPPCRKMADVSIPMQWVYPLFHWGGKGLVEDFELAWGEPKCGKCEKRGGICGYKGVSSLEIGCSKAFGLSTSAKDAIIVGVGIPGLVCMIGLAIFACHIIKISWLNHLNSGILPTTAVLDQRSPIRVVNGLDKLTIESYPTLVLGQSGRVPKPSDDTCPICLCEYEPKEILKSFVNGDDLFLNVVIIV
ncbi:putative RING-H2 finger protein atl21a [Phtheirospermum japonicum]|uniref:Putative RING-H2 finger protein atl21a n=1 Tax=Phtheirospermum japonicum TaxID=374723 RepID=A0A830BBV4_9LAMI|nr:putative RING-H2 finger protein atl21a [Phtheirospermum japonicum]